MRMGLEDVGLKERDLLALALSNLSGKAFKLYISDDRNTRDSKIRKLLEAPDQ